MFPETRNLVPTAGESPVRAYSSALILFAILGCADSGAGETGSTSVADGTSGAAAGTTAITTPSGSTSSTSSSGTGEDSSTGDPIGSSTDGTGEASVCRSGPGVDVISTISAPAAKMPGFGTYFEAVCAVTSAEAATAELLCDGDVGEVSVTVQGIAGLDLAGLPEQVLLDVRQTSLFENYGSKHTISTSAGALLFSYVGVAALEVLEDPWEALSPVELDWTFRDCAATSPEKGVSCSPAMLIIETPDGTSEAAAGEVSTVAGGWQAFVSSMAACTADWNYVDQVRFAIVSDTLL